MSKKLDRAAHGPSWTEVFLGAVLSSILGVVLGAGLMVLRPVEVVKDLPKPEDRKRGVVYVAQGAPGDASKAKSALIKRKQFAEGQSVSVTEEELNSLLSAAPTTPPPAAKPDEKSKAGDKPAAAPSTPSGANVRLRDGVLQVWAKTNVDVAGLSQVLNVHARGRFAKDGAVFVYQPDEIYIGGCPVQRLPFLPGYVREKFLAQPIPDDVVAAWRRLTSVTIEGKTLKLVQ